MAELTQQPEKGQGRIASRSKRRSTKVDLTPMVDLGFLLITFFILTTTLSQPKQMQMHLPAGEISDTEYGESTVLTIIPLGNEKIFFYHGDPNSAIEKNSFGVVDENGVRALIMQKQLALDANPKFTRKDLALIIKPTEFAIYKNIVGVMDEVLINDLKHYSFVDISADEKKWLSEMALLR
jgi:biopolymer transport protein ExbD